MTIEEFREQNPNRHGNLCWNCKICCSNLREGHDGYSCDGFIMADKPGKSVNNLQRSILLKALRNEYNTIMGQSSNYFYTKIYRNS